MQTFGDYYTQRVNQASKDQGTDQICEALAEFGIKATSEQTGGFTMCAFVQLTKSRYIYANLTGAGIYDQDGFLKDLCQYDEIQTPQQIALDIHNYINR